MAGIETFSPISIKYTKIYYQYTLLYAQQPIFKYYFLDAQ